jgi:uncharacterized surface protein with fasciclin (FAS1) repeats
MDSRAPTGQSQLRPCPNLTTEMCLQTTRRQPASASEGKAEVIGGHRRHVLMPRVDNKVGAGPPFTISKARQRSFARDLWITKIIVIVETERRLIQSPALLVSLTHALSVAVDFSLGDQIVRKILLAATLAASTSFSSVGHAANIVETASNAGTFQTLLTAAQAAGLVEALSSGKNLTVFAPTDEAFAKLPDGTVDSLLKPENKEKLAAILSYHVLPRELTSNQLPHKAIHVRTIKSGGDRTLRVTKNRSGVTVDNARVVKADIKASNGVIHIIDEVMLPSS